MEQTWSPRVAKYHLAAIVLVAALTHGLLLLMDGVYWDGRLLYSHLSTQNWPALRDWFGQAGLMFFEEFYRAVGMFPGIVFGYRLAAFLSILLSAVVCYLICRESRMVSPWEGLFISLIQLTFPAFRVLFCIILLPYLVCYLLFLTGVYLAIRSYVAGGRAGLVLRLLALGGLFLSYSTNSFLVFHAGFLGFMILLVGRMRQVGLLTAARRYLSRHVDFLVLPLVYWGIKEFLCPRYGVYSDYNAIRLSAGELAMGLPLFLTNAVVLQLNDALLTLMGMPVLLLVLVVALLFVFSRRDLRDSGIFGDTYSAGRMAWFGAGLLALAVMPYVLVGKIASATRWNTRFSLLVGLSIAVIIVAMARGLGMRSQGRMSRGSLAVLMTLVLAFAVTMVSNYIEWQGRWVKDKSVMLHLSEMPPCPANTYWIEDRSSIADQDPYSFYEWSSIFKEVWGGESRIGLPETNDRPAYMEWSVSAHGHLFDRQHNLSDYNPKGPQAVITIIPGRNAGDSGELVLRYWYNKFVKRDTFEAFVRDVTEVKVEMLPQAPSDARAAPVLTPS